MSIMVVHSRDSHKNPTILLFKDVFGWGWRLEFPSEGWMATGFCDGSSPIGAVREAERAILERALEQNP